MKRLSIFDLQEGKVYAAFDGDRRLGKNYTVKDGKLMNASKDEDPNDLKVYEGCSWVPLKASVGFEEIKNLGGPTSILGLKQGMVYKASAQLSGFIARAGRKLMKLDQNHKVIGPVDLEIVSLTTMFTPVAELAKAKRKKASPRKSSSSRR